MSYVTYATNGIHFKVDNHQFTTYYIPDFVFTIDTRNLSTGSSAANQFKLPLILNGSYNMTVDWGDNSSNAITAYNQAEATHSYASQGVCTVKISGQCRGFRFNNSGDRLKILNIANWGASFRLATTTAAGGNYFQGCANLTISATDNLDLTAATNLNSMFSGCASLTTAPTMALWDTSQVTIATNMFNGCSLFNQPIGNWNTANVTAANNMFYNCFAFNQPIGNWNLAKVTTLSYMFSGAKVFNQPIGAWGISSKLTTVYNMFQNAFAFNQDVGAWDMSKVVALNSMFQSATAFNNGGSPSINNWSTASCLNMTSVFSSASAFNQPIGNWNTANVTNMASMFYNCTVFNQPLDSWDVSKVTSMYQMFCGCSAFNQPIGNWNTANVTNMSSMFNGCSAFNQPLDSWDVSKVANMNQMFTKTYAFKQNLGAWAPLALTDASVMFYSVNMNTTGATTLYDALLNGWAAQAVLNNVPFGAGSSKYSAAAADARAHLTATHGWTITDGGLAA